MWSKLDYQEKSFGTKDVQFRLISLRFCEKKAIQDSYNGRKGVIKTWISSVNDTIEGKLKWFSQNNYKHYPYFWTLFSIPYTNLTLLLSNFKHLNEFAYGSRKGKGYCYLRNILGGKTVFMLKKVGSFTLNRTESESIAVFGNMYDKLIRGLLKLMPVANIHNWYPFGCWHNQMPLPTIYVIWYFHYVSYLKITLYSNY